MAAREGVGAALTRRLHILLETSDQIPLTRFFRERDLTWINRKRVTSVEVNSNIETSLRNEASWGYMVKPHGSLVSVSSMHCCTSTPDLSTT